MESKLLRNPEDYLALLEGNAVGICGGPTSDLQSITHHTAASREAFLHSVRRMMKEQPQGPYLMFYDAEV